MVGERHESEERDAARFPDPRPRVGARFYKGHGLGNDYLVVEEAGEGIDEEAGVAPGDGDRTDPEADRAMPDGWTATPEAVRRVCHPHEGLGSDGIVVLLGSGEGGRELWGVGEAAGPGGPGGHRDDPTPFRLRMFNPDGSEFERSGNGLRVLASHLHRTGRVRTGEPFEVSVGGDTLAMTVHGVSTEGAFDVSVGMGSARVGAEAVALDPEAAPSLRMTLVSVGNPHCVVFPDELRIQDGGAVRPEDAGSARAADSAGPAGADPASAAAADVPSVDAPALDRRTLERFGPWLAEHPAFRHGTNVQLARVESDGRGAPTADGRPSPSVVRALVWERGVGHTTASGTSACAVAVAAVTSGRVSPGSVEVQMEGGSLRVEVSRELEVVLRGPVREVMEGRLAPGFLRALQPGG